MTSSLRYSSSTKMASLGYFVLFMSVLIISFPVCCYSASSQKTSSQHGFASSAVFPLHGNVYPDGIYTVSLNIGDRIEPYILDIDTGSDLTWLQCDAPCVSCSKDPEFLYKPRNNLVFCQEPLCTTLSMHGKFPCSTPRDQCDYEVEYADLGSSLGVLVRDHIPLKFSNGSRLNPSMVIGCGYNQQFSDATHPPSTDGVLGLGMGKLSIVSQLHEQGLTRNVLGHCMSGRGGGFLFFGDEHVPSSGVTWSPLSTSFHSLDKHYTLGPGELLFGGKSTGIKGLRMVFDSGSSYTYFSSDAYQTVLSEIRKSLKGKPLKDASNDKALPVCWKGEKPFTSVDDVKKYFRPLALSFPKSKSAQLQLRPEAYLIVTNQGSACLGILNGTAVGLDSLSIIGDISLQDKLVIYDNEKQRIGWVSATCDRLPNKDRHYNKGTCQPHASATGELSECYPAPYASRDEL